MLHGKKIVVEVEVKGHCFVKVQKLVSGYMIKNKTNMYLKISNPGNMKPKLSAWLQCH